MAFAPEGCISWLYYNFRLSGKCIFSLFFWRKKTTDIWWDWLNHINFLLWVYWKHLYPKLGKMLARNVPHSNRSAIGVAESCRRIVIMWIKLHLATLVSWDFPWLHASRHWAKAQLSILTAEPEKTKVFCFSRWKKKWERKKGRCSGEKQ